MASLNAEVQRQSRITTAKERLVAIRKKFPEGGLDANHNPMLLLLEFFREVKVRNVLGVDHETMWEGFQRSFDPYLQETVFDNEDASPNVMQEPMEDNERVAMKDLSTAWSEYVIHDAADGKKPYAKSMSDDIKTKERNLLLRMLGITFLVLERFPKARQDAIVANASIIECGTSESFKDFLERCSAAYIFKELRMYCRFGTQYRIAVKLSRTETWNGTLLLFTAAYARQWPERENELWAKITVPTTTGPVVLPEVEIRTIIAGWKREQRRSVSSLDSVGGASRRDAVCDWCSLPRHTALGCGWRNANIAICNKCWEQGHESSKCTAARVVPLSDEKRQNLVKKGIALQKSFRENNGTPERPAKRARLARVEAAETLEVGECGNVAVLQRASADNVLEVKNQDLLSSAKDGTTAPIFTLQYTAFPPHSTDSPSSANTAYARQNSRSSSLSQSKFQFVPQNTDTIMFESSHETTQGNIRQADPSGRRCKATNGVARRRRRSKLGGQRKAILEKSTELKSSGPHNDEQYFRRKTEFTLQQTKRAIATIDRVSDPPSTPRSRASQILVRMKNSSSRALDFLQKEAKIDEVSGGQNFAAWASEGFSSAQEREDQLSNAQERENKASTPTSTGVPRRESALSIDEVHSACLHDEDSAPNFVQSACLHDEDSAPNFVHSACLHDEDSAPNFVHSACLHDEDPAPTFIIAEASHSPETDAEDRVFVEVSLGREDRSFRFLGDSGSQVTLIRHSCLAPENEDLLSPTSVKLLGANKLPLEVLGKGKLQLNIRKTEGAPHVIEHEVYVVSNLPYDGILGQDLMSSLSGYTVFNWRDRTLSFLDSVNALPLQSLSQEADRLRHAGVFAVDSATDWQSGWITARETVSIPPMSECILNGEWHGSFRQDEIVTLDSPRPFIDSEEDPRLEVAHSVHTIDQTDPEHRIVIRVFNGNDNCLVVGRGDLVAQATKTSVNRKARRAMGKIVAALTIEDFNKHKPRPKEITEASDEDLWNAIGDVYNPDAAHSPNAESDANEMKQRLFEMLKRHRDKGTLAFGKHSRLGKAKNVEFRIRTTTNTPTREGKRPLSKMEADHTTMVMSEMLEDRVVEPSNSPWAAALVLAKKPGGGVRFCIDYRRLNAVTVADAYPMANAQQNLDALGKSRFISTLDLNAGYWQFKVHKEDRPKTAFWTPAGLFQFRRMPFGLVNAPALFQRTMDSILSIVGPTVAIAYIDDVAVFSETFDQHIQHLDTVLTAFIEAGLTVRLEKCHFCKRELPYLGHIVVAGEGVKPDPERISAIQELQAPTTVRGVRAFLGITGYYRKFVEGYSSIAAPLHRLLQKTAAFTWGRVEIEAFDALKERLISAPILVNPDFSLPFVVRIDASKLGLGATLSNLYPMPDGTEVERVVAYASWSNGDTAARWKLGIPELEALTLVRATDRWRHILFGRPFKVITDHYAHKWLMQARHTNPRIARWAVKLSAFLFSIETRAGTTLSDVDGLSRSFPEKEDLEMKEAEREAGRQEAEAQLAWDNLYRQPEVRPKPTHNSPENSYFAFRGQGDDGSEDEGFHDGKDLAYLNHLARKAKSEPGAADAIYEVLAIRSSFIDAHFPKEGAILDHAMDLADSQTAWTAAVTASLTANAANAEPLLAGLSAAEMSRLLVKDQQLDVGIQRDLKKARRFAGKRGNFPLGGLRTRADGVVEVRTGKDQISPWRIYVPVCRRGSLIRAAHDSVMEGAHLGYKKTLQKLSSVYFWPKMGFQVDKYVKGCVACRARKGPSDRAKYGLLQPIPVRAVKQVMGVDLLGPFRESDPPKCNKWILTVTDHLSKWLEIIPLKSANADEIAQALVDRIFMQRGAPDRIISDQGANFWKDVLVNVNEAFGIARHRTATYNPQVNGTTERANRTITNMLSHFVSKRQTDWDQYLSCVQFAYNTSVHASTGFTPFFLEHGREARLPTHAMNGVVGVDIPLAAYSRRFQEQVTLVRNLAAQNNANSQAEAKRNYDKGRIEPTFAIGQKVMVRHPANRGKGPGTVKKLTKGFQGPFLVAARLGASTYRIELGRNRRISEVTPANRMFPLADQGELGKLERDDRGAEDDELFEVESVVDVRDEEDGSRSFLVEWRHFSSSFNCWVPEDDLKCAQEALREFWKRKEAADSTTTSTGHKNPITAPEPEGHEAASQQRRSGSNRPAAIVMNTQDPNLPDESELQPMEVLARRNQPGSGAVQYQVRWRNPGRDSTWEFAAAVPTDLVRAFTQTRRAGRARKRHGQ